MLTFLSGLVSATFGFLTARGKAQRKYKLEELRLVFQQVGKARKLSKFGMLITLLSFVLFALDLFANGGEHSELLVRLFVIFLSGGY